MECFPEYKLEPKEVRDEITELARIRYLGTFVNQPDYSPHTAIYDVIDAKYEGGKYDHLEDDDIQPICDALVAALEKSFADPVEVLRYCPDLVDAAYAKYLELQQLPIYNPHMLDDAADHVLYEVEKKADTAVSGGDKMKENGG